MILTPAEQTKETSRNYLFHLLC